MADLSSQDTHPIPLTHYETISQTNRLQSPLLRLPHELREKIYHSLFYDSPSWIRIDVVDAEDAVLFKGGCTSAESHAMQLYGIILASKQLYDETFQFYHPSAIFYLYSINAAIRRLGAMKKESRDQLRRVRVCSSVAEGDESWSPDTVDRKEEYLHGLRVNRLKSFMWALDNDGIVLPWGVEDVAAAPDVDRVASSHWVRGRNVKAVFSDT